METPLECMVNQTLIRCAMGKPMWHNLYLTLIDSICRGIHSSVVVLLDSTLTDLRVLLNKEPNELNLLRE